jgi:hypothetical protein
MRNTRLLLLLLFLCVFTFVLGLYLPWRYLPRSNEFGDTAGAVNGFFSALAFAGVIYAILQQNRAIHHQRLDLQRLRYFSPASVDKDRQITILLAFIDIRERLHRAQEALARHEDLPGPVRQELTELQAKADAISAEEERLIAECREIGFDIEAILKSGAGRKTE